MTGNGFLLFACEVGGSGHNVIARTFIIQNWLCSFRWLILWNISYVQKCVNNLVPACCKYASFF